MLELFVAERATHHSWLMQALVVLELDPVAQLLPTICAGVAALVVLDPLVPGHVVVLAEGLVADWTLKRPLLGVHPHVSGQFVGPPERPVFAYRTEVPFWLWFGRFIFFRGFIFLYWFLF